jgi:predicted transcriptional regulator
MKTKTIIVRVKSLEEALDEFVHVAKAIKTGKSVEAHKGTYIADVETARAIFTVGRLKIIQILKVKSPQSIYALAKLLDRDFKNVYDEVTFLTQLGILKIEEASSGRHQKKPILLCDKILFEMAA